MYGQVRELYEKDEVSKPTFCEEIKKIRPIIC